MRTCCSCAHAQKGASHLDSLDWSKKYEVLSISRLYLRSLGFTNEQITRLTDEDMQRIADTYNNRMFIDFEEDIKFIVSLELAEKGTYDRTGGIDDK